MPGVVLAGRYRVDSVLGEGGMALVFEGHHLGLDRAIAVKVLKPEFVSDRQILARFEREARAVSRLEHPGIVRMLDVGTADVPGIDTPLAFLVMERLRGAELSDVLRKEGPAAAPQALAWLEEMLGAIGHAHGRGIVHRDLKPENVFVCEPEEEGPPVLKLVDFGIAKMVESSGGALTQVGMIFGTPGYMSPEQATGMPVDARTDLYSVGVMFYEMLSGRVPFAADDVMEVLRMHVREEPPSLPVAPAVAEILSRLLAKAPEDRYENALAALEAARAARATFAKAMAPVSPTVPRLDVPAADAPVLPQPASVGGHAEPARRGVIAITACVVALVGVGALALLRGDDTEAERAPVVEAVEPGDSPRTDVPSAAVARPWKAAHEALAEVDDALEAGNRGRARTLLGPLLASYPNDPAVVWRAALAEGRPERASERRAELMLSAIELDPEHMESSDAQALILRELARAEVPVALVDLALDHGAPIEAAWIRALLGRTRNALPYEQRHRLFARAASSDAWSPNEHLCLDLWQASDAPSPCETFSRALDAMEDAPSADFRRSLQSAPVPSPGPSEDASACEDLADRRDALREAQRGALGDDTFVPADFATKARSKRKRRRTRLRDLYR
jgi:serine/threonine-protein kinase